LVRSFFLLHSSFFSLLIFFPFYHSTMFKVKVKSMCLIL
jgi:hypothetical protein